MDSLLADRARAGPREAGEQLKEALDHLPREPGVYLMKNADGQIVYIGKAKSLRARVRS